MSNEGSHPTPPSQFVSLYTFIAASLVLISVLQPGIGSVAGTTSVTTHWATIEEYLKKHDDGAVKKYDDDLNTLLVFVGKLYILSRIFLTMRTSGGSLFGHPHRIHH